MLIIQAVSQTPTKDASMDDSVYVYQLLPHVCAFYYNIYCLYQKRDLDFKKKVASRCPHLALLLANRNGNKFASFCDNFVVISNRVALSLIVSSSYSSPLTAAAWLAPARPLAI